MFERFAIGNMCKWQHVQLATRATGNTCNRQHVQLALFTSMLTIQQSSDIERIQKIVLKVILGRRYTEYEQACKLLSISTLESLQKHLYLKFALACLRSPQHSYLFKQRKSLYYDLRNIKSFEVPHCHTKRYSCSPIPY